MTNQETIRLMVESRQGLVDDGGNRRKERGMMEEIDMREIVKRKDPEKEVAEAREELGKIEAIIERIEKTNAFVPATDEINVILKALQVHASAIRVLKLGEEI